MIPIKVMPQSTQKCDMKMKESKHYLKKVLKKHYFEGHFDLAHFPSV